MSTILNNIFLVAYVIGITSKLIDSFKNPTTISKFLHYSSGDILFIIFTTLIVLRLFNKILLPRKAIYISIATGIFLLCASFIAALIDYNTYVNYVYSKTLINIDQIFLLSLFLIFSGVFSLPNKFFKKRYPLLLFLFGIFLVLLYYMYGFFPLDARHQIAKEDQLIENYQAIIVAISGVLSVLIFKKLHKKHIIPAILFLCIGGALLFLAGDEISWGQRIFNIKPSETLNTINTQKEITIHNIYSVQGFVPYVYILAGLYGSCMWLISKPFKKSVTKYNLTLFIPQGFLFPFFFSGFFYNFYSILGKHNIGDWSEPTELMLYLGVFFYLFVLLKTIFKKK